MRIAEELKKIISETGLSEVKLEHPANLAFGDYACHARGRAQEIAEKINQSKPDWLDRAEAVGAFVNFYLSPKFFADSIAEIGRQKENFGRSDKLAGQKTIVEYTDPNPFKEFHIGHLMSNAIGEAVSRLIESQGAEVKRACYQGDVGLHVAKAVWGLRKLLKAGLKLEELDAGVLGSAYADGAMAYESPNLKEEIIFINKEIYELQDGEVKNIYQAGRKVSLEYFETIYRKLGSEFDFKFFESEAGPFGKRVVEENIGRVFEESDGAVIFRGDEQEGLHTRVFINSEGLPTYEAKELGLAKIKHEVYPYDESVVITGNEIAAYFKVLLKVMSLLFPDLTKKTRHLPHGMLRLQTGKMSSRTGDVITAESLLADINHKIIEKTHQNGRSISLGDVEKISVAAIKYSILRQSPGRDIIFDFERALSFEGDSGPYLQYTCVRAKSVLEKAVAPEGDLLGSTISAVERLLYRFPEVVERSAMEYAPNYLVTYLTELASAFNTYYAQNKIIGSAEESYRLALTTATAQVLENGLTLLGIRVPEKM